jgi:hypothetical protein
MEDYKIRIESILNNLYTGGGRGLCKELLKLMLDSEDIHPEDVLNSIAQLLSERKRLLEQDCILPINRCNYFLEDGKTYTCLDKDLKFCIRKKGTPEWNDVSHVLTRFNPQIAVDLIHQHEAKLLNK